MRIVIYDKDDHEPITVIHLPKWAADVAIERGHVRLYTFPDIDLSALTAMSTPMETTLKQRVVTLSFEPVYKGKELLMWLVYADDPESALLLRSTFLPGQRGQINEMKKQAFLKGLIEGLSV